LRQNSKQSSLNSRHWKKRVKKENRPPWNVSDRQQNLQGKNRKMKSALLP